MTLKRIFNWLIGLPVAVIGIGFAVANRQWITVSFDPVHRDQPYAFVNMPVWALVFAGIFIGIFFGWWAAWRGGAKHRKSARDARIELVRTQRMHEALKQEHEKRTAAASVPAVREDAVL